MLEWRILFRTALMTALFAVATSVVPVPAFAGPAPEPGAIERTIPTEERHEAWSQSLAMPAHEARDRVAGQRPFTLGAVNVDGSTVFSQAQLSRYFESYLATEVDRGKLVQMADAITARYRQAGYLLSYAMVPSQNVEAGMVRLAVVEGRIGNVQVQGAGAAAGAIEAIASPLAKGGPLKMGELERTIGLIRDFPGVTVADMALVKSDVEPGLYTLKIRVVPDRTRAFSYADNRGTGSIGRSRLYNSFAISSVLARGDEYRVDLFAMPGGDSRYLYGQVSAALPVGRNGMRFQLSASRGDQYLRGDEHFAGLSDNVSAQLSYPFLRSRALTLVGKTSLTDWRSVGRQLGTRQLHDRLRVARLGVDFANEGKIRFQGEAALSQGLGFGAMTKAGDPLSSRPDASGRFTKASLSVQVASQLSERVTLHVIAMGQYSNRPLLSAEEFSLGGNRIGRAYRFNAETGDRGGGGGLEISYRLGKARSDRASTELFAFTDAGVAVDMKSALAPQRTHSIGSAGIGTRFAIGGSTVAVETGVPLSGDHHSPRLFASIFRSF